MIKIKYFVHGTTTDNIEKKATGWLDGVLSEKGICQATELGKIIKDQKIDIVISSDLKRAVDSAQIVFGSSANFSQPMWQLRECNYGDYNGQDSKLVDYSKHIYQRFPNGECMQDVEKRMAEFIEYLKQNYDGKTVAIVAHRAPQLALEVLLNGKTWEQAIAEDWRNTKSWQPGWDYVIV